MRRNSLSFSDRKCWYLRGIDESVRPPADESMFPGRLQRFDETIRRSDNSRNVGSEVPKLVAIEKIKDNVHAVVIEENPSELVLQEDFPFGRSRRIRLPESRIVDLKFARNTLLLLDAHSNYLVRIPNVFDLTDFDEKKPDMSKSDRNNSSLQIGAEEDERIQEAINPEAFKILGMSINNGTRFIPYSRRPSEKGPSLMLWNRDSPGLYTADLMDERYSLRDDTLGLAKGEQERIQPHSGVNDEGIIAFTDTAKLGLVRIDIQDPKPRAKFVFGDSTPELRIGPKGPVRLARPTGLALYSLRGPAILPILKELYRGKWAEVSKNRFWVIVDEESQVAITIHDPPKSPRALPLVGRFPNAEQDGDPDNLANKNLGKFDQVTLGCQESLIFWNSGKPGLAILDPRIGQSLESYDKLRDLKQQLRQTRRATGKDGDLDDTNMDT